MYTFHGDFEYIYNNIIYSKLGEKVYTFLSKKIDAYTAANLAYKQGYSRNNKHGISKFLMEIGCNRHKVAGSLDLIYDIIDILSDIEKEEKKENAMTIGDTCTNQVEEEIREVNEIPSNIIEEIMNKYKPAGYSQLLNILEEKYHMVIKES